MKMRAICDFCGWAAVGKGMIASMHKQGRPLSFAPGSVRMRQTLRFDSRSAASSSRRVRWSRPTSVIGCRCPCMAIMLSGGKETVPNTALVKPVVWPRRLPPLRPST